MQRRAALAVVLFMAVTAAGHASEEHPIAAAQQHQRDATVAYRAGDYAGFTRSMEQAYALNPASFPTMYNLACGYARTGQSGAALELLEKLAVAGVDYGMENDPDLASLRELPEFGDLVRQLEERIVPINNSTERLAIDRLGFMPEGIAVDPASGRLFFGSMRTGEVFVVGTDNRWSRFADLGEHGPYSAIGMTVDASRGLLWVVGTWFFQGEAFDPEDPHPPGLFGIDLESGAVEHAFIAAEGTEGFNDVAVAPDGAVFISGVRLHVLESLGAGLHPFDTDPAPFGSNGITVSPDGATLYIASYPVGVGAIDLATRRLEYLEAPAERPLYGIDGLYWHEGSLLGIQNGIQPWRLLHVRLAEDQRSITSVDVLEFANPVLTPTTGAIDGATLHYIGQGPAPEQAPSQFPAPLAPFLGRTVIMTIELEP